MARPNYILLTGQGRSGTKWLLDLFDTSPDTFCRNEPNVIAGSPFGRLASQGFAAPTDRALLDREWDEAVAWTCGRMGERDRYVDVPKHHLYSNPASRLLRRVIQSERGRRVLGVLAPPLRRGEWPLPRTLGSRARLAEQVGVLKFVAAPGWARFVLESRPEVPVVHIVRHPGGFLNSWSKRFLAKRDPETVARDNRARLKEIARADPRWAGRFGDCDGMSKEEGELWNWLYGQEITYEVGRDAANYHQIVYEELAADAAAVMRPLFAATGIAWTDASERALQASNRRSGGIAAAWRDELDAECNELVAKFTEFSKSFCPRLASQA